MKGAAVRILRKVAPTRALTFPLGEWGRLGNQLFQIASTYAIARTRDLSVAFRSDWPYRPYFDVPSSWFRPRVVTARSSTAIPFVGHIPRDYRVYLQDIRLWDGRHDEIKRLLQPSELAITEAIAMEPEITQIAEKTALHVRRGDYTALNFTVPLSYYERALDEVRQRNPHAETIVFSDDPAWARANLPGAAIYAAGNPDWADIALMTLCDHHICANSTFSWWGAFLSDDAEPIYPWMPGGLPGHFHWIYPEHWREITVAASA